MFAQRTVDGGPHAIWVAKHLTIPEAKNSVAFPFDHAGTRGIRRLTVLATIDFDYELCSMTREVGNEVADRNLSAEMILGKGLPQQTPE